MSPEKKTPDCLRFTDVIRILRLIDEAPFQELQLELGELRVRVVRDREEHFPVQPAEAGTPGPETDQGEPFGSLPGHASPRRRPAR